MVEKERVKVLKRGEPREGGKYVLYWMQGAQRVEYNHALEYAIEWGNKLDLGVVVGFGLTGDYPDANLRHYQFMLEGLQETAGALSKRRIKMVVLFGEPWEVAVKLAGEAALAVVDGGFVRVQRQWRQRAAEEIGCPLYEVETNLVVPVEEASGKEEFAARTIRPKIHKKLGRFLRPVERRKVKKDSRQLRVRGEDISDIEKVLKKVKVDRSVGAATDFVGGTSEAKRRLKNFIKNKLSKFGERRNDATVDYLSGMSPYLHFGQVSPVYVALEVKKKGGRGVDEYLEELIVRRELAFNFVYYNDRYDEYEALEPWAKRTLNYHSQDKREYIYSREKLERGRTHDVYWNAAQKQMVLTGKMHGYMRMYWGKKILEWSRQPAEGFATALYLNNKYELDGRDPNGFAGVAWCFGKHDRAWGERPVFGKVRYMNANGLKRKFDADEYVRQVDKLGDF